MTKGFSFGAAGAAVLTVAALLFFASVAQADTHTVNPGESIQTAITAATAGDIVSINAAPTPRASP